jgi:hypothetical protein
VSSNSSSSLVAFELRYRLTPRGVAARGVGLALARVGPSRRLAVALRLLGGRLVRLR